MGMHSFSTINDNQFDERFDSAIHDMESANELLLLTIRDLLSTNKALRLLCKNQQSLIDDFRTAVFEERRIPRKKWPKDSFCQPGIDACLSPDAVGRYS